MNIPKNSMNQANVSFSGHSKKLDKTGYVKQHFYYLYDPDKYSCEVELFNIVRDSKGNMDVETPNKPQVTLPMKGFSVSADMFDLDDIDSETGFAYRFKLTDNKTKEASYAFDNGTVIGIFDDNADNKYNVVLNNRAIINKNGPMQLIMPDSFYPGIENVNGQPRLNESLRAKALASTRTHANKFGGNFYGIIARLDELEKEGVKRIVGTPFTKDTISSHKYWTENIYQISPEFGNEEEFKALVNELFKHDINWISDAALVNEGFGGIHFSELLRKGDDSFSKNMFRAGERISLGIIPDNCEYTKMKIINAPFVVEADGTYKDSNPDYNPAKPTYLQVIDERLASREQQLSDSPKRTTTYDNKNTDNIYEITKHDDAAYPFPIEVSPKELQRNAKRLAKENGKIDLKDVNTMKNLSKFKNFDITVKSEASGLEVWDGNVDIAKLNFFRSDKDDDRFAKLPPELRQKAIEEFDRGALAAKDYAISSCRYWTKSVSDILVASVSQALGTVTAETAEDYMDIIKKMVNGGKLPDSVLEKVDLEVIQNVLDDNYNIMSLDNKDMRSDVYGNDYEFSDYILKKSMDYPLESLPFSSNLLGVMTSPYIAKKANVEDELDVSRFDISQKGNPNLPEKYAYVYEQADNLYKEQIVPTIKSILKNVDGLSEDLMVSDLGKYVISEITPELTKYLFIKAINPNADIKVSFDGQFDFTNVDDSDYTIQSLGIPYEGMSLEEEAQTVVNILKQGIENIPKSELDALAVKVGERFKDRTLNDFKVAEVIIDRTEAGLGWRIDATKDVAAIDSVRANTDSMTNAWKNVTDLWKRCNTAILDENQHAYTTAEITDLYDLFKDEAKTVFTSDADAERKFLEETGIIAVANYNYFFSLLPEMFANFDFEKGDACWRSAQEKNFELREKLDTGWSGTNPGFLFQSPDDGVKNSYTFFGNHDKPRPIHGLALDMGLYNTTFNKSISEIRDLQRTVQELSAKDNLSGDERYRKGQAEMVLNQYSEACICLGKPIEEINDTVSGKAIAMGSRLRSAFYEVLGDTELTDEVNKAIAQLAQGSYRGESFDANAFGKKPFEITISTVLDQVEYNGTDIKDRKKIEAEVLKSVVVPAYDRYYSMYKLLTVLPGSPTDFAGDKVSSSGSETKTKNYDQQNRNVIRWEWLEDDNYKFVKEFYDNSTAIANLRSKPELSALNDGDTVTLPIAVADKQKDGSVRLRSNEKMQAMLRYNEEGSVVLAISDLSGASSNLKTRMDRKESSTETNDNLYNRIVLSAEHAGLKQGLKHGLKAGTTFKNERSGDNSTYKIATMKKDGKEYYYLKRIDAQGKELPITIKPEDFNTLILYKA